MPVTRISIREGKTPEYKQPLMDEIYEAMRETVAIKDVDRFMAITEHASTSSPTGRFSGSTVAMISFRSRCSGRRARRSMPNSRCTRRSSSGSESTQGSDPRMC
jgi:Tautomerase enzyme